MVAIVIPAFQGMAPRFADALLKETQASFCANLQPTSGKLSAFKSPLPVATLSSSGVYRRAQRIYKTASDEFIWFKSVDVDADVVKNPLATDSFERIYFTELSHPPQITTYDNLKNNVPSKILGHPRPSMMPGLGVIGGGGDSAVIAYTYTTVSIYGEESGPAPPNVVTAFVNSTSIQVHIYENTWPPGRENRVPLEFIDIYRSATGDVTSGAYFRVGRIPFVGTGELIFTDSMPGDQVPLQPILDTYSNDTPFQYMAGLIQHSSGALVGFNERTVYFSLPYLPHAWPQDTQYVVKSSIIGLVAISNAIVALTKSFPVVLSGNSPDTIQITNMTDYEPCVSKRSIVATQNRALYASPNGLIMVSVGGLEKITNDVVTRDEWLRYHPERIVADVYGSYYIGFTSENGGVCLPIPPYEPVQLILFDRYSGISGVDNDERTGDLYLISGNTVLQFDALDDRRFPATWRSKEFIQTHPINFGAIQVLFLFRTETAAQRALREAAKTYNEIRFAAGPLDGIGLYPVGGSLPTYEPVIPGVFESIVPETLLPIPGNMLGGEPLYDLNTMSGLEQVRVTVFGDGVARYTKIITNSKVNKMPSGYKATRWYIELSGTAEVDRLMMAETGKELAQV